ncbi:MAG: VOC family protein, partial [Candidatus Heimdallarchaeota archaeon]|nr:VOC family protein [Candidatus Heimdallarchaeota archaeon]
VTIVVRDIEEALSFYVGKLGFEKKHDFPISKDRPMVMVAPKNQKEVAIVLRKPFAGDNELLTSELDREIGRGSLLTFSTSNCNETYEKLKSQGVKFINQPIMKEYGLEAIFEDNYGNRFSILEIK